MQPSTSPRHQDSPDHPGVELTVVVPVHNGQSHILHVLARLEAVAVSSMEVVVVDDHSNDKTADLVAAHASSFPTRLIESPARGAGQARNAGLAVASGRFTLFLDADDDPDPGAISLVTSALARSSASLAMTSYSLVDHDVRSTPMPMFDRDLEIWSQALAGSSRRMTTALQHPQLLEFTNYPWNKILRTDYYRQRHYAFGRTSVHNDILGHWLSLMFADSILLIDRPLCLHELRTGTSNLTNRQGSLRLQLVAALRQLLDVIDTDEEYRSAYRLTFWAFAARTGLWASNNISPTYAADLSDGLRQLFLEMSSAEFARLRQQRDRQIVDFVGTTILGAR